MENLVIKEDQGAEIVDLSAYDLNPALILQIWRGYLVHHARDLAAALYRNWTYDFAQALYVVGNEQTNHFKQLKAVLKKWASLGQKTFTIFLWFDYQRWQEIVYSERQIILLEEVLLETTALAKAQIAEKNPTLKIKTK